MHCQQQFFCVLSLVTFTFDLDIQTCPSDGQNMSSCEFCANPFSDSRDISYTNKQKKSQTALKTESYLCAVKIKTHQS